MARCRTAMQEKAPANTNTRTPSPQGGSDGEQQARGVNVGGESGPFQSSTPQKSPSTHGGSRGGGKSPQTAVSRVLNLDCMSGSTPSTQQQRVSTPTCPTSNEQGGKGKTIRRPQTQC